MLLIRLILFFSLATICASPGYATIIFQDNFDGCTTGCTVGSTEPNSGSGLTSWAQWGMSPPLSATISNVTKYSGEITSPGRGGSGKSLKNWRGGVNWIGSESYSGPLYLYAPSSYSDFYIRFYVKIPVGMDIPYDTKMFRLNTSGGNGQAEIYVNFMGESSRTLWVWGNGGDSSINTTIVDTATLNTLRDGNWHAWQFRFNLSTGTVTFWADGVQLGQLVNSNLQQGGWNSLMQHFPLGNSQGANWQATWEAFETDDLVIATTKAETDPIATPDTTPPVRSNGSPTGALAAGTTQTTMAVTTDENATCKYSSSAGTAYTSMTSTFSTTGGTSHSATISGMVDGGSYARYARCSDGTSANTDDYAISWSVSAAVGTPISAGTTVIGIGSTVFSVQ